MTLTDWLMPSGPTGETIDVSARSAKGGQVKIYRVRYTVRKPGGTLVREDESMKAETPEGIVGRLQFQYGDRLVSVDAITEARGW